MLVCLSVKMMYVLVLCPVLLAAAVQTLTIDSQLGTSIEDCFERISIGEQLPRDAIYRNVSELTTRECEQICKQDKQCQSYDYGVGAKGNATCELSNVSEKELKEKNLSTRHPDYDLYVRRFQCEQSAPSPLDILFDEPSDPPSNRPAVHRPVYRPVDEKQPFTDDFLISSDLSIYGVERPVYKPQIDERPDDYSNPKPDHDSGPSYGSHKPQDISYPKPIKRPNFNARPDPFDVLRLTDIYKGTESPGYSNDDKPFRRPYVPEKIDYQYINKNKPKPQTDTGYGFQSKPEKPSYSDTGYTSSSARPIKESYKRPKPSIIGQYGGGHTNDNTNYIHVEIRDPPRPYDRPKPSDQGTYGYGTYSSQNSYSQSQSSQYYGSPQSPDIKFQYPPVLKPNRPSHGIPAFMDDEYTGKPVYATEKPYYGSGSYGSSQGSYGSQSDYSSSNQGYGSSYYGSSGQKPASYGDYKPGQDYGDSYGDSQSGYGSNQSAGSSYGGNKPPYGSPSYGDPYWTSRPTYANDRPSYGNEKPSYDYDRPSYGNERPSYATDRPAYGTDPPSYGGNKPSYGNDPPAYGSKPSYGNDSPGYGNEPPAYGNDPPAYGNDPPPYGNDPPSYGNEPPPYDSKPSYGDQPSYPNDKPSYGNDPPSYGNDKPSYGNDAGYGSDKQPYRNDKPSYGNDQSSYGNEKPSYGNDQPGYGDDKPSYGNDQPGYGNDKPSYGNDQASYGNEKPSYGNDQPGYGNEKPSYGIERPTYGNDKPLYESDQSSYGGSKPSYGSDSSYGSGSYGSNQGSYGSNQYYGGSQYGSSGSNSQYGSSDYGYNEGSQSGSQGYGGQSYKPSKRPHGGTRPSYDKPSYGSNHDQPAYQKPSKKPSYVANDEGYSGFDDNRQEYFNPDDPLASDVGYGNEKPNRTGVKPVYEHEKEKPYNVPSYIARPGGEIVTSRPMAIGDFDQPGYRRNPVKTSYEACFRRVLAGQRALRSHVRKVVPCERLEDCRRECATEKRFPCESFNYRLDRSFRGKGLCELMTKPIEAFNLRIDFVEDKDFDFYERDRNSLEPNCPDTLRGPGILHSGFLSSSKPNRGSDREGWKDRNDWYDGRHRDRVTGDRRGGYTNRYRDSFYIPYQINQGLARSNDDDNWGQYGGEYGGTERYYKDRNDYHKSISHWRLASDFDTETPYFGVKHYANTNFDYNSLGKNGGEGSWRYGNGSWKRGRWDSSGNNNGLEYGESNFYKPKPHFHGVNERGHEPIDRSDDGPIKDCSSRRRPGMSLGSGAIRRSLVTRNVVECEAACFGEREFKCVSYSFRYSSSRGSDNCFLSERPYRGLELSADSDSDVYAMPQDRACAPNTFQPWLESECFWHVRSGAAVSGAAVRSSLTVAGLGACEAECIRAHFFCRGFSFRFDSPTIGDDLENCILTSSPPTSLDMNRGLRPNSGHELYARGNYGRGCEPALYDDVQQKDDGLATHLQLLWGYSCLWVAVIAYQQAIRLLVYPPMRGNYERGCESALYDDVQKRDEECYLQYDKAAKLTGSAVKGQARVKDERSCGQACNQAPFTCLSFSFNNKAPPNTDNCLLSEIRLFDLQRGTDYEHSTHDWLFAFDLFNGQCWRKIHQHHDESSEVPRPLSSPPVEDPYSLSGPSGPPGLSGPPVLSGPSGPSGPDYPPGHHDPPFIPSGPPSGPGYKPDPPKFPSDPGFPEPSGPGYKPHFSRPQKPGFPPESDFKPGYPEPSDHFKPIYPGSNFKPGFSDTSGPDFKPSYPGSNFKPGFSDTSGPNFKPNYPGSNFKPSYPEPSGPSYPGPNLKPGFPGTFKPGYSDDTFNLKPGYPGDSDFKPDYPPTRPGYPGTPIPSFKPGYLPDPDSKPDFRPQRPGYRPEQDFIPGKPGYLPEKPGYLPDRRPGYPEPNRPFSDVLKPGRPGRPGVPDREINEPISSWRHYTVSGFPCRAGTTCGQNHVAGHWACEPEGGEIGSWDYCCAPTHRCGYSEGFHKPWCYVGPNEEQWRPCSEKYYPYHQHNVPHPSQGQLPPGYREPDRSPQRPWPRPGPSGPPGYNRPQAPQAPQPVPNRPQGPYLSEADRRYWDNLYKNGPQAYYDQYGNPLPGYTRVPTAERPHIKYNHNYPRPGGGQWQQLPQESADRPPPALGVPRYWPVAYLHKSPPPNTTYFRFYNETERPTTTTEHYSTTPLDLSTTTLPPNNVEKHRDEKKRNISDFDATTPEVTTIKVSTTTTDLPEVNETVNKDNKTEVEMIKPEHAQIKDVIKGIDDKIDDFSSSIEVLDLDDVKGDKLSDLKTLEAEERQIEEIGRILASRRGGKLVLDKRSQKDLETKSISVDKDLVDFNFGNKFNVERRGLIQKVSKDEIERERNADKSLEVSETAFVRPPRILSTTENIRKAIVNGKVFYDATIRDQRDTFLNNSTRKSKSLKNADDSKISNLTSVGNFGRKIVKARNINPVRRVRRVYRKRYNPEEVRRRLLEREKSKQESSVDNSKKE